MPKITDRESTDENLSKEEVLRRQAPLLHAISEKMEENGHTSAEFAAELGVSPSFVTAIYGGYRWVPKTKEGSIRAIAKYLGVSKLQICIWAGEFDAFDMVVSTDLPATMKNVYELMFKEPIIRHIVPNKTEFFSWPESAQLRYVLLFEVIHNRRLLQHASVPVKKIGSKKNIKFILDR